MRNLANILIKCINQYKASIRDVYAIYRPFAHKILEFSSISLIIIGILLADTEKLAAITMLVIYTRELRYSSFYKPPRNLQNLV